MADMQTTPEAQMAYWNEYFAAETENYKKILANKDTPFAGTLPSWPRNFPWNQPCSAGLWTASTTA